MGIVDGIKDTARKATNSSVDVAEKIMGVTKSPKELVKRFVEHLNHREYSKIAMIITDEVKKYAAKMGLDNGLVKMELERFKMSMDDLAEDLEEGSYKKIADKLRELELSVPEEVGRTSEVFKTIKSFLSKIRETLEGYAKDETGGAKQDADFSKLQKKFEENFNKLNIK